MPSNSNLLTFEFFSAAQEASVNAEIANKTSFFIGQLVCF
jgi:hypothetical protein